MLIAGAQELDKALTIMKPYVDKAYDNAAHGAHGRHFPLQFAWSSKKLTSLDDFKHQKILNLARAIDSSNASAPTA